MAYFKMRARKPTNRQIEIDKAIQVLNQLPDHINIEGAGTQQFTAHMKSCHHWNSQAYDMYDSMMRQFSSTDNFPLTEQSCEEMITDLERPFK